MLNPVNGKFDEAVRECFKKNKNSCISFWLVSSYCYYIRHESLMSDEAFDKMSKWILDNYETLEHNHKHLVTREMLQAGSGYNLKEKDYPTIVKVTAEDFIKKMYEGYSS